MELVVKWPSCKYHPRPQGQPFAIQLPLSFERALKEATKDVKRLARTEILEPLIKSGEIYQACKKTARGSGLEDDLNQEIITELLLMSEEKFIGIYERGSLRPYIASTLYKMFNYPSHSFYKKFRLKLDEITWEPVYEEMEPQFLMDLSEVKELIQKKNEVPSGRTILQPQFSSTSSRETAICSPSQEEPEYLTKQYGNISKTFAHILRKNLIN